MHRKRRLVPQPSAYALFLAVLSVGALAGCGSNGGLLGACPEMGWLNELTVELSGETGEVRHLELCDDTGCTPSASSRSAAAPRDLGDGRWVVTLGMTVPESLTLRARASDGSVLAETEITPDWRRVGGTERCGGPHEGHAAVTL